MLEARGLTLRLGGRLVLDRADFAARPGEVTAVVGPNGAGKSTLLACLSGALRPEGAVRMAGVDPASATPAELARLRAVLEQTPALGAPFPVRALAALAIPREIAPDDADRIVRVALDRMGLTRFAERPATELSGGERHRAHMARALAQLAAGRLLGGGRWLLLDEPTASLDLAHQSAAMRAARAAAQDGAGVVAVLHDLGLAAAFADRVAVMQAGRIVADGPPRAIFTPERLSQVYGLPVAVADIAGALTVAPLHNPPNQQGDHPACSSP